MATPAFIYAFDNLGPYRFTELCGLLFASRYKGFLLGGVGADGKIDGEIDNILNSDINLDNIVGILQPESESPLDNILVQPDKIVIFQFKHIVVARAGGQSKARRNLLSLYKSSEKKQSELLSPLITKRKPAVYILVTNIEINSKFRSEFTNICLKENSNIEHFQILGLDELESWITNEKHIRHLYFPTIFGLSRFNLQVKFSMGFILPYKKTENLNCSISILNIGEATSYIDSVVFKLNIDGKIFNLNVIDELNEFTRVHNPKLPVPIEAGRKQVFTYPIDIMKEMKTKGKKVFPIEVVVTDEIGNEYRCDIWENFKKMVLE